MSGFDKFLKGLSEEGKKKLNKISKKASDVDIDLKKSATKEQERERTLSEKYAGYDDASDAKKQRIENRDKRRKERYAESEKRTDAKRERYAEKMAMKGIVGSKQEARVRFDNIRGITKGSALERERLSNLSTGDGFKKFTVDAVDLTKDQENKVEEQSTDIVFATAPTSSSGGKLGSFDYNK
jgi:outer membrane murein-binding lipoprotein Lpp